MLNVLITKKKWELHDVMQLLANAAVVIVSRHLSLANQHMVHLQLTQRYKPAISQ